MIVDTYKHQVRAVFGFLLLIGLSAMTIATLFWYSVCNGELGQCLGDGRPLTLLEFLAVATIRPLVFTPITFTAIIAAKAYGTIFGGLLAAFGGLLSTIVIWSIGKFIGRRIVRGWFMANLPTTSKAIRDNGGKIVLISRLVPVLPFDFQSLLYGVFDFRFSSVLTQSFFGSLPYALIVARLAADDPADLSDGIIIIFSLVAFAIPMFMLYAKKPSPRVWISNLYREIVFEIRENNEIEKKYHISADRPPVLLIHGFFSSRRSLTVMDRILTRRGFDVVSFNLGGLFGVLFTRGILETAQFIDKKIQRLMARHEIDKIHIVAHSKGGLVALWWLLKLGGHRYCDKVITLGTPYNGSYFTYLGLFTPLGFFWRDLWQMRPGSAFLEALHHEEVPEGLKIMCIYSSKDRIARAEKGLFRPKTSAKDQVEAIPMNHVSHFDFLYRRDVGELVIKLLKKTDPQESVEIAEQKVNQ